MKKRGIIYLITLFNALSGFSQDSTIALSKYERFSSQTGKMFKNESMNIGKTVGTTIFKERTTDLSNGEIQSAVKIAQVKYARYGTLFIDLDELDGVIKSLTFYLAEIKKSKPKYAPYFFYVTTNDVVVRCSYEEGGGFVSSGYTVSLSKRFHYSKETILSSYVHLKNKEIDDFIETMQKAKAAQFN